MADSLADPQPSPEERLALLESALKFDERLKTLESILDSGERVPARDKPWWRDAKTITILAALLAAVIPLVTAIDGLLKNARESQRALSEQQDKIRQSYLDRVLKPGVSEIEQQRVFNLLSKLKGDPEFQEWAREESGKAIQALSKLGQEIAQLEERNRVLLAQIESDSEKGRFAKSTSARRKLEQEVRQGERRVAELRERTGEEMLLLHEMGHAFASASRICQCPTPPGGEYVCDRGQVAVCTVTDGKCIGRCIETTINLR